VTKVDDEPKATQQIWKRGDVTCIVDVRPDRTVIAAVEYVEQLLISDGWTKESDQ
jgi:hypothetical protein